jgi:hypothetical protein
LAYGGPSPERIAEWLRTIDEFMSTRTGGAHYSPWERSFIASVRDRFTKLRAVGYEQPLTRKQCLVLERMHQSVVEAVVREMHVGAER